MVKAQTITLVQSIIALMAVVTNASLQTVGRNELNKTTFTNPHIKAAKTNFLAAMITQFVAVVLIAAVLGMTFMYREQLSPHTLAFMNGALFVSGLLLLVSGSLGANIAVQLQCYKGDPNIKKAWEMATISATIGILGVIVLLMVQAFIRRDTIKERAREYLIRQPRYVPAHKRGHRRRAVMPAYHPPPFAKV